MIKTDNSSTHGSLIITYSSSNRCLIGLPRNWLMKSRRTTGHTYMSGLFIKPNKWLRKSWMV